MDNQRLFTLLGGTARRDPQAFTQLYQEFYPAVYGMALSVLKKPDASADAARTYLLFWLAGDIETAEKYLDLFCKKTDTAKQYVQKWLPIVAASQSVKGKPEEREFLMHWVNVVEYE